MSWFWTKAAFFSRPSDAKRRSSSVSRTLHHLGVTPFEDTASPGAGNNPQMHPGGRMKRTAHCGFTRWKPPCLGVIICYFWLGAPQKHPKTATQALRFGKWKANKPHQTPFSHIFASNHFPNNGVGPSTAEVPRPLHLWVAAYSWGCSNHSYGGYIPTSGGPCLYPLVTPHCSPNRPHGHRLAISAGDAMSISVAVKLQMSPKTMVQRVESSTCSPKFSGYTQNIHNSPKQTKESTSMEDFNIPNGHWKTSKTKHFALLEGCWRCCPARNEGKMWDGNHCIWRNIPWISDLSPTQSICWKPPVFSLLNPMKSKNPQPVGGTTIFLGQNPCFLGQIPAIVDLIPTWYSPRLSEG